MHKRLQISLLKSLLKNPFQSSPKLTSPFFLNSLANSSESVLISKPYSTQSAPNSIPFSIPHYEKFHRNPRNYSTESRTESGTEFDYNREVDMINLKFAEAREEIEMAMDSKETVYFDEEAECARAAVKEVLDMFDGLLNKLKESEKETLQRSMGLKIEQLKAELKQLDD
ncbi:putative Late embryogenesis abundant protein [Melia azedarach]|uniref:Late embryogenesis abundant protein n=2 Tax=Melia azedarach TaxID=155640 RepID=A0ACC1WQ75_MELAZ|nr:putative Late embryogenesis abundant protein [Melia azedarach]KAJ4701010.1 putative Late embryogenesis abundant protein [Melia azedarach]